MAMKLRAKGATRRSRHPAGRITRRCLLMELPPCREGVFCRRVNRFMEEKFSMAPALVHVRMGLPGRGWVGKPTHPLLGVSG